jgi:hypothetical protein
MYPTMTVVIAYVLSCSHGTGEACNCVVVGEPKYPTAIESAPIKEPPPWRQSSRWRDRPPSVSRVRLERQPDRAYPLRVLGSDRIGVRNFRKARA